MGEKSRASLFLRDDDGLCVNSSCYPSGSLGPIFSEKLSRLRICVLLQRSAN